MGWIEAVRSGDFHSLPNSFMDWLTSAELISQSDLEEENASAIYFRAAKACRRSGTIKLSALDLLTAAGYAACCYRESGSTPKGDELVLHDRLARATRTSVLSLNASQKAAIMSLFDDVSGSFPTTDADRGVQPPL